MINKSSNNAKAPTGLMRYPEKDFDANTDYVMFTFYDYTAPFSTQGGGGVIGNNVSTVAGLNAYNKSSSGLTSPTSRVLLYMPEDIEGAYGASWQDTNLSNVAKGALGTFGSATAGKPIEAFGQALDTLGTTTDNFLTKGTGVANAISSALSGANFGSLTVNDIFGSSTGQILNPNTEVLYKGPKMRNFSLNFKMAPKNNRETVAIKNIIRAFKYATLPRWGGAGNTSASFIKVPQIVDVTFKTGNTDNPWVTQFKPAVITSLDVSYTPDGAWATLPDGSPTATTLRISFQETKMVYADELPENGATY